MRPWHERTDDEIIDEESIHRMWRGIEVRRAKGRLRRRWSLAAPAVIAAAAGAMFLWSSSRSPAAPLRLASGVELPSEIAARVVLSDGSVISPQGGTVRVLANRADVFEGLLSEGDARFEVTPGGPRRWIVECGWVQVEVAGTVFEVRRRETFVRVSVERGAVLVRSTHLPEGVRRLEPGESVEVRRPEPQPSRPLQQPQPEQLPATQSSPFASPLSGGVSSERQQIAPAERESFQGMLARADRARAAGESAVAERILLQALARYPGHRDRGVAWFTVARIRLRKGRCEEALGAIDRALEEGLPEALREVARARRTECLEGRRDGLLPGPRDESEPLRQP